MIVGMQRFGEIVIYYPNDPDEEVKVVSSITGDVRYIPNALMDLLLRTETPEEIEDSMKKVIKG